jgi:PAS domain S-box-containing protein
MAERDRTERVLELIDELMLRDEKLEGFLDASPWGILVVDKTFQIVYINKRLSEMSGYKLTELIGRDIKHLMPPEDAKKHKKHENAFIKAPHEREGNHGLHPRLLCKDGSLLDVEISLGVSQVQSRTFYFASIRRLNSLFNTVDGKEKGT